MSDDDLWQPRPVPPSGDQVPPPPTGPSTPPPPATPSPASPPYPTGPTYPTGSTYPFAAAGPYAPTGFGGYVRPHGGASTAMTLGIVSLVCAVLAPFCWLPVLGTGAGPFAIVQSLRAKRDMRAAPGTYGSESQATAGLVTGIIGTVIGAIELVVAVVLVVVLISDPHA